VKLGLPDAKTTMMPGCNHHSCARFSSRENENYVTVIQKVKRILKSSNEPQEAALSAPKRAKEAGPGVEKGEDKRGNLSCITYINIDAS
jgi:hypothetical protein